MSDAAVAAIERARSVHRRNGNTGDCEHCSKGAYPDYSVPWPCQTILALDYEPCTTSGCECPDHIVLSYGHRGLCPQGLAGCTCTHAPDEHSVYGCEDGCSCEWMPKR